MLDISFHFKPVFSLDILHEYYADQTSSDFLIVPSNHTAAKVRSLGFIIKQTGNNIKLLCEEAKLDVIAELPIEEHKFTFFLYSSNPYFYNFTQLPIEPPKDQLFYFTNDPAAISDTTAILSKDKFVGKNDYINISEIKEVFPDIHPSKKLLACISLYIPSLVFEKLKQGEKFTDISTPTYSITFAARETYWKYAFIQRNKKTALDFEISNEGTNTIPFTKYPNEVLLNKQEASIFISDAPLKLFQRTEVSIALQSKQKNEKAAVMIPRLPVPTIEMVKPESRKEDAKIYSEVVVYI